MSFKTMYQQLVELNAEIEKRLPGFSVQVNDRGKFVWSLVNPDGKVECVRDSFDAISEVALQRPRFIK